MPIMQNASASLYHRPCKIKSDPLCHAPLCVMTHAKSGPTLCVMPLCHVLAFCFEIRLFFIRGTNAIMVEWNNEWEVSSVYDIKEWRHVFKLDPNKEISDEDLELICESGTDAIIIGGTDGVTLENVLDLMSRVRRFTVPCVLEIRLLNPLPLDLTFILSLPY